MDSTKHARRCAHIDQLVVVEGYMDAVALARHGIDFAVATLGTATTSDHLNRLFRLTENVCFASTVIAPAGKPPGARSKTRCRRYVKAGRYASCFLPDGHDPDSYVNEFGTDAFLKALDEGVALSEFLIDELASQVDMSTVDGRARLAELARPLVHKIPMGVYRELLIESLAEAVGLTAAKLEKMLGSEPGTEARPGTAGAPRSTAAEVDGGPAVGRQACDHALAKPSAGGLKARYREAGGVSRPGTICCSPSLKLCSPNPI